MAKHSRWAPWLLPGAGAIPLNEPCETPRPPQPPLPPALVSQQRPMSCSTIDPYRPIRPPNRTLLLALRLHRSHPLPSVGHPVHICPGDTLIPASRVRGLGQATTMSMPRVQPCPRPLPFPPTGRIVAFVEHLRARVFGKRPGLPRPRSCGPRRAMRRSASWDSMLGCAPPHRPPHCSAAAPNARNPAICDLLPRQYCSLWPAMPQPCKGTSWPSWFRELRTTHYQARPCFTTLGRFI